MSEPTTDFGFERVASRDKARRVAQVFDSVAPRYDLMNDLMSMGLHRLWKRFALSVAGIREGQCVLDLAGGTGDLTRQIARRVGPLGRVVLTDINANMLTLGRGRLLDDGVVGPVQFVQADAEALPFPRDAFHCICIAFGLRNVTRKQCALQSMFRVLRPGGKLVVLEFSKLTLAPLKPIYDGFSFRVLPWLGRVVAGDSGSYRYLAESIREHPEQERLKSMMEAAGFERCSFHNLSAGIVAVHQGYKL